MVDRIENTEIPPVPSDPREIWSQLKQYQELGNSPAVLQRVSAMDKVLISSPQDPSQQIRITETLQFSQYLQTDVGTNKDIQETLRQNLKQAQEDNNPDSIQENLRLAELLGIDQSELLPVEPRRAARFQAALDESDRSVRTNEAGEGALTEQEGLQVSSRGQQKERRVTRTAPEEAKTRYIENYRSELKQVQHYWEQEWSALHPVTTGQTPEPLSLREIGKKQHPGDDPESQGKAKELTYKWHQAFADSLFDGRYQPLELTASLAGYSAEDQKAVLKLFQAKIRKVFSSKNPLLISGENGENFVFDTDPEWLKMWSKEFHSPGVLRKGLGWVGRGIGGGLGVAGGGIGEGLGMTGRMIGDTAGNVKEKARWIRSLSKDELKEAAKIGFRHWAENLNPANIVQKDWMWRAGFGFGAVESVAFVALPLPVKGFVKAGLNLAITQAPHLALNLRRARAEVRVQKRHAGYQQTIDEEMAKIAEKYSRAGQRIKEFALGLSAGAMYLSVGSLVSEIGKETLGWDMQRMLEEKPEPQLEEPTPATTPTAPTVSPTPPSTEVPTTTPEPTPAKVAPAVPPTRVIPSPTSTPEPSPMPIATVTPTSFPTSTSTPTALPTAAPMEISPTLTPEPTKVVIPPPAATPVGPDATIQSTEPPGVVPAAPLAPEVPPAPPPIDTPPATQAVKEALIKSISESPEYAEAKAAEVGKVLQSVQEQALRDYLERNDFSLSEFDEAGIKRAKELIQDVLEERANIFFDNNLQANPGAGLAGISEAGRNSFESWLASGNTQEGLSNVFMQGVSEQMNLTNDLTEAVTTTLQETPNLFTDQAISQGATVGQMLQDGGYQVTWSGSDAPILGAHLAANYDTQVQMWQQMAAHQNIPENPFPVGINEINYLVTQAQLGDKEALRKLLAALRFIPAGQRFKILNKEGIATILGVLP